MELVAFEGKGLSIQGVVVILSYLISDSIDVLAVVEILEDATNLIIGVSFTLLIEWIRYIYCVENSWTMMSEYVKHISTSTCQNDTMRPKCGNVFKKFKRRLTCRQHLLLGG